MEQQAAEEAAENQNANKEEDYEQMNEEEGKAMEQNVPLEEDD